MSFEHIGRAEYPVFSFCYSIFCLSITPTKIVTIDYASIPATMHGYCQADPVGDILRWFTDMIVFGFALGRTDIQPAMSCPLVFLLRFLSLYTTCWSSVQAPTMTYLSTMLGSCS